MRRLARAAAWAVGALAAALALTQAVYRWPDLLPPPLRRLGNALVDASGSQSAETSADIEWVFVFGLSLGVVLMLAWLVRLWMRRGRRP